jgi:hypothetical protein
MNDQAKVDAVFEDAEYGIVETGGGGEAWENRINGFRILVTDLGGISLPTADDIFLVGIYASDDAEEALYLEEYPTAAAAVKGAEIMAKEMVR